MSIIDTIANGVTPIGNNAALQALAKILGSKLILGSGDESRLVLLSAALNPVYIGLLFLILAYIGVGGVVKSALEGRFLGRWSQVGVPGMFMLCIVLLSPVPSQSGATLGQVVFAKSVKFGSNFADYILKSVFEVAADEQIAQDTKVSLHRGQVKQVNDQMVSALPMYICGEQLKNMGYGTRVDYFVLLHDVCGIPADLHGQASGLNYTDYYTLNSSNKTELNKINANIKQYENLTGLTLPKQQAYDISNINAAASGTLSESSEQLKCHFKSFQTVFNGSMTKYSAAKVSSKPAIAKPQGTGSGNIPSTLNSNVLEIREEALKVAWPEALYSSYKCLRDNTKSLAGKIPESKDTTIVKDNAPWNEGWVYAARIIEDDLAEYAKTESASAIPLNPQATKSVNYKELGDSLVDKRNIAILTDQQSSINRFITTADEGPSTAAQALGDLLASGISAGKSAITDADVQRVGVGMLLLPTLKNAAMDVATTPPSQLGNVQAKYGKLYSLLNSFIGRAATFVPTGLGKVTSLVAGVFKVIEKATTMGINANKTADDAAKSAPFGIGSVISMVKGAATVLFPTETALSLFVILLTAVNAVVLLPQIILLVVMFLWIARAAVWYMVLPIATVLIALPETRVGHDIWKSALGIVITPAIALIFYLVSLQIFDISYGAIMYWIFEPITHSFNTGSWSLIKTLFVQIVGGELFFRMILGMGTAIAITMYMASMILKGPDLVIQALGLRTNSGELGDDLHGVVHRLNLAQRVSPI